MYVGSYRHRRADVTKVFVCSAASPFSDLLVHKRDGKQQFQMKVHAM